ncbi:MAG: hypothetical protein M5U12_35900 [Verrucomicrobia bacterium]|nr:hypothetical protein [Verrucomicrobiota bacterium]
MLAGDVEATGETASRLNTTAGASFQRFYQTVMKWRARSWGSPRR